MRADVLVEPSAARRVARGLALAALVVLGAVPPDVAAAQPSAKGIAEIKRVKCTFDLLATGTWVEERPQGQVKEGKLELEFTDVDTQESTATAKGGFGAPHVVVRVSGSNLHFLQMGSNGALYLTTVFNERTPSGRLKAVHTRHEYTMVSLPGYTSRPEQYYGLCEVGSGE